VNVAPSPGGAQNISNSNPISQMHNSMECASPHILQLAKVQIQKKLYAFFSIQPKFENLTFVARQRQSHDFRVFWVIVGVFWFSLR